MAHRLHDLVAQRAGRRCEYCHLPESFSQLLFVCDHIVARKHLGPDGAENLALSCAHCNSHKLDNVAGMDWPAVDPVRLFNPRRDAWTEHFRWDGAVLIGLTPIGRATVQVLAINDLHRVRARRALMAEDVSFK